MVHLTFISNRRVIAASITALVLFILLEWLPWMIQDRLWPGVDPRQQEWIFWAQTFSGNWAPWDKPPVGRQAYAFSAVIAFLMNNALGFVVVGLIWQLVVEWSRRMKLKQVLASREQVAKEALYERFPEEREAIQAAFRQGNERWHDELIVLVGSREATRLTSIMNEEV